MSRRSIIPFLVLVIVFSVAGTLLGLQLAGGTQSPGSSVPRLITVQIVVTATPNPNVTPQVIIITATPLPGQVVGVPPGIVETQNFTLEPAATINPEIIGSAAADDPIALTASALPPNCILHTVASGDTPFGIAEQYGADGNELMAVNGLTEETAALLQIGEVLIVPLPGCPLEAALPRTAEPTETPTLSASTATAAAEAATAENASPSPTPTITLAPTARNAQVEIVQVIGAGDVTSEGVEIRNNGPLVDLVGWTLSDSNGNTYVFPELRLFTGGQITVYTRAGEDTAIVLFWNRDEPVFGEPGDTVTLANGDGQVQATLRLPAPVNVP